MGNKWQTLLFLSAAATVIQSSPANADEVWRDFMGGNNLKPTTTAILSPRDDVYREIGRQVKNVDDLSRINIGTRGSSKALSYGGKFLPPTSTAAVDITVTEGAGGFYLYGNDEDYRAFMEFSQRENVSHGQAEFQRQSQGDNWYLYERSNEYRMHKNYPDSGF